MKLSKILNNRNATILGCDVETTGLLVAKHAPIDKQPHMIEYGGLLYDGTGRMIGKNITLINPPVPIPNFIQRMTGIEEWRTKNFKAIDHYAKGFKKDIESSDLFVGQNVMFDHLVLSYEFERLGIKVKWPPLYCTIENSMYIRGRRLKNDELLLETTGETGKKEHRAETDIKETMKSFFALNKVKVKICG